MPRPTVMGDGRMTDRIQIAYCFDDHLALPGAVAMLSLLRSNPGDIDVHVCTDPDPKCATLLHAIAEAEGASLRIVTRAPEKAQNFENHSVYGGESTATYRRIFLPDLLPELDRVIYIDADTIVAAPLRPLWELPLDGKTIAAVRDPWMMGNPAIQAQLPGGYFNAGVLLVDMAVWRAKGIREAALAEVARLSAIAAASGGSALDYQFDQMPLNFALADQWVDVSPRWNFTTMLTDRIAQSMGLTAAEFAAVCEDPAIVHMLGSHKPWLDGFETLSVWHRQFDQYRRELEANFDVSALAWPGAFTNGESVEMARRLMAMRLVHSARRLGWQKPAVVLTGLLGPEVARIAQEQRFPLGPFITEYPTLVGHQALGMPIQGIAEAFASGVEQVIVADYRRLDATLEVLNETAAEIGAHIALLTPRDR